MLSFHFLQFALEVEQIIGANRREIVLPPFGDRLGSQICQSELSILGILELQFSGTLIFLERTVDNLVDIEDCRFIVFLVLFLELLLCDVDSIHLVGIF